MPYGITQEVWDELITDNKFARILKQMFASQSATECVILIWHEPAQTGNVQRVLRENGFQEFMNYYWVKENHHTPTPASSYTSVVEQATVGFYPSRSKCFANMQMDPRLRSNVAVVPAVTKYHKDQEGKTVNPCQKPTALFREFCKRHCPPGSNILVLGAGSLGEVIGAVDAGCNVVAVDSDPRQFMCMQNIIIECDKELSNTINGGDDDKDEGDAQASTSSQDVDKVSSSSRPSVPEPTEMMMVKCAHCGEHFGGGEKAYKCTHLDCEEHYVFHGKCVSSDEFDQWVCMDHFEGDLADNVDNLDTQEL